MIRRLLTPLLCLLPLLLAATPAAAFTESPRTFIEDEMVSGTSGWAQTYQGLYWTDDGGHHWRDISPSLGRRSILQGVQFADPEHGWAAVEEGDEPHPRAALLATVDGGRSWTRTRIQLPSRYATVGDAYFSAVGAHRVFALVREARNTAFSIGFFYVSDDGGRHWSERPTPPPHAGPIAFVNSREGWLAEDGPQPALYRTRDGGRSWSEVRLPRPPGLAEARADYLAPRFEAGGQGLLAATYDNFEKPAVTVLYTTIDSGRHWTLAASHRLTVEGDPAEFAYRGDAVFTPIVKSPRFGLLSPDGTVSSVAGAGLPLEYGGELSFDGDQYGFDRINSEDCEVTRRRANCTQVNGLYFSADGGESWVPTARPGTPSPRRVRAPTSFAGNHRRPNAA